MRTKLRVGDWVIVNMPDAEVQYRFTADGSVGVVCGFKNGKVIAYFHKMTGEKRPKNRLAGITGEPQFNIFDIYREHLTLLGTTTELTKKDALALAKLTE